jgi:hypothetical protein
MDLVFLGPLLLPPRRLRKEQSNGLVEVRLIFFHDHQVVPALIQDLLSQMALGMERIRSPTLTPALPHRASFFPANFLIKRSTNFVNVRDYGIICSAILGG